MSAGALKNDPSACLWGAGTKTLGLGPRKKPLSLTTLLQPRPEAGPCRKARYRITSDIGEAGGHTLESG